MSKMDTHIIACHNIRGYILTQNAGVSGQADFRVCTLSKLFVLIYNIFGPKSLLLSCHIIFNDTLLSIKFMSFYLYQVTPQNHVKNKPRRKPQYLLIPIMSIWVI